jgi:hypothetical protein
MPYNLEEFKNLASRSGGFARTNLFRVIFSPENAARELNLLCTNVSAPGRQILTNERIIGMTNKRVAYGYAVPEVTMTFITLSDYYSRNFFEEWQSNIIDQTNYTAGYYKDFVKDIGIQGLRSGGNVANNLISGNFPAVFKFIDEFVELNPEDEIAYSSTLIDAYPTSLTEMTFSNEADGIVTFSVSFVYKDWSSKFSGYKTNFSNNVQNSLLKKGFDLYKDLKG